MSNVAAEGAGPLRIAVLDDYQRVALSMADWSAIESRAAVEVFDEHWSDPWTVIAKLRPFDAVCVMRERTPLTRLILENLPRLKIIASTGPRNASIDERAAKERGIEVVHTGYNSRPTIELTWALIRFFQRRSVSGVSGSFVPRVRGS